MVESPLTTRRPLCSGDRLRYGCDMIFYRILLAFDGLVGAVLLYFFVTGIEDGSVSSFNILLWLAMLGGFAAIIGLALGLRARGHKAAANFLLLVPALPGLLAIVFLLMVILLQPDFR